MELASNQYKIKSFVNGSYLYDTIYIDITEGDSKVEYQIPINKSLGFDEGVVGKTITLNKLCTIEEKPTVA